MEKSVLYGILKAIVGPENVTDKEIIMEAYTRGYVLSALGCLEINLLFESLLFGRSFDHWTGA